MNDELRDHGDMEERVARLETDITAIKIDVAVIKANGATKSDVAELRAELQTEMRSGFAGIRAEMRAEIAGVRSEIRSAVSEAKSSIIMWVAGLVFMAQLIPAAVRLIDKYI
ncbi:hypothetical protein F2P44_20615 [Massilia sp. CCM 8695]|uniref:DUF1640 domain-containing protein n=1 Tax=Massilia frigida TaxID=2609281 RepID=A0ABX0N8E1_9BURK|nr:hypothetical protein [Massilia frigida]NHZ81661.1 hypothetical protein [Massilia frigida]